MRNLLVLLVFTSACAAQQYDKLAKDVKELVKVSAPKVALVHVKLIDGSGAQPKEDQTVVVSDGKIAAITTASEKPPADAQVVDLTGRSLIPGLVGMHDHLFYPAGGGMFHEMGYSFPRLYLAAGVTSIRTTGSLEPYTDLELKKQIDDGESPGPRINVTGP